MSEDLSLPITHVLIIICVIAGLFIWYVNNEKINHINDINYKYNDKLLNKITSELEKRIYLKNRDINVLYNDLEPPERRLSINNYPDKLFMSQINIPTQGSPDSYQLLGFLHNDNEKFKYKLFGRPTFPTSNEWEYYIQEDLSDIKIPLDNYKKELYDDDDIQILGENNKYRVKLYKMEQLRYNPLVI